MGQGRPECIYMCIYIFFKKIMHVSFISYVTFFMKNMIIIKFYLIILYKMYYKSNIESIHLFVTKTKCLTFLQVDIFNKKGSNFFFREFPAPILSCPGPDRDETGHVTKTPS